jgi:hypothetical protein
MSSTSTRQKVLDALNGGEIDRPIKSALLVLAVSIDELSKDIHDALEAYTSSHLEAIKVAKVAQEKQQTIIITLVIGFILALVGAALGVMFR